MPERFGFPEQPPQPSTQEQEPVQGLNESERAAIHTSADMRIRQQEFKVNSLNLEIPSTSDKQRAYYENVIKIVQAEASGERLEIITDTEVARTQAEALLQRAQDEHEVIPNLAAFHAVKAAKLQEAAGESSQLALSLTGEYIKEASDLPKIVPSSLLPDAMMMGIQSRAMKTMEMPALENVARTVIEDPALLKEYALVLSEKDRDTFLKFIPEDKRQEISQGLDIAVAGVLHQSLVEKGGGEESQRKEVRARLYNELRDAGNDEPRTVKALADAIGSLGEDTRQLILDIVRDTYETTPEEGKEASAHFLPRVLKVLLDNFDDFRGNDIALHVAADPETNRHIAVYLYKKLIANGYLEKDLEQWWKERTDMARAADKTLEDEIYRTEIVGLIVNELGSMPSADVARFIADDSSWMNNGEVLTLPQRVEQIRASKEEFDAITESKALVHLLHEGNQKAMLYYLLHGVDDRFNLINNYSFDTFKEMLELIDQLEVHNQPLRLFREALEKGGVAPEEAALMIERLKDGHFPLANKEQAYQEVSFEVSENAAIKNANAEIGQVLGKDQLGTVLRYPLYRDYLEKDGGEVAHKLLKEMNGATTFEDRKQMLAGIDRDFPSFKETVVVDLQDNWKQFGEKMLLELGLSQVFDDTAVAIKGEELLPRLDAKRIDLKRIKKDTLVLLKGENKELKRISGELSKKKKARIGLVEGLSRQADPEQRRKLEEKIFAIDKNMKELEAQRTLMGNIAADERFSHLSEDERKAEIEQASKEIIALTEKSPSAIFTYITMQVLDESRLTENDITLIQEMESHLQGPFQTIQDTMTYQKPTGQQKKRSRIGLQYVDKAERLMNMVRFADSKICCFSSNNYNMKVQHDTPNKYWVASINADPLSFVVSIEMPTKATQGEGEKKTPKENLGFVFGNYGIDDDGKLSLMLNGIYYAPGIEDEKQVQTIIGGVENIFKGIPIDTTMMGSQYGGSVRKPDEFKQDSITMTRLRALDDGAGRAETKIYDDLATGSDLNKPHNYSGSVWHKKFGV